MLDSKNLLRRKKSIKRELLAQNRDWIDKKIAVLGGSTTNEVIDQIELQLLFHGIRPEFYQSEYNRFYEDSVFGNELLDEFKPDVIYIHTNWRNILQFEDLQTEFGLFKSAWLALKEKFHCPIIQNNFDRPNYRLLGNRDIWDSKGKTNFIFKLNSMLYEFAQSTEDFYINDIDYLSAEFGLSRWQSSSYWHLYKYAMNLEAIPLVAKSVADIIKSIYGKNKKLIALDLDGTLWHGIIGEDGVDGIEIGNETASGQLHLEFQKYLKDLQSIGVIFSVNSKNNLPNALAGLNHPDGILKPEDFVSIKANWNSKDQNLIETSEELSLGLDSFVFVDDTEFEREIVRENLPMVAVPEFESAEDFLPMIDRSGFFEVTKISTEDLNRTEQYKIKQQAENFRSQFKNYDEYLSSLQMTAEIKKFEPMYFSRITQLVNKTNQFNLTTKRFSESEIRTMAEDPSFICLQGRLKDRFGDYGIVSLMIGHILGDEVSIDLFLMSCRVLNRNFENKMIEKFFDEAKSRNVKTIIGKYFPTKKNSMVKDLYSKFGFEKVFEDEEKSEWIKKF